MRNIFKRTYYFQGHVQFFEDAPALVGNKILWLDTFAIEDYTEKRAEKKVMESLEKKYPEYKGYIQIA